MRTFCEDPSGTTSWAQLHILWACLCSSQVAHGLCEVPSMKVLTRGRMKEHWWGSFHDLSRLLAFYSLLRWPQTPCQQHMACACHVAPEHWVFPAKLLPRVNMPWRDGMQTYTVLCLQWRSDVCLCNCSSGQLCDLLSRPSVELGQAWKNESYALKMYPMSYNLRVSSRC